MLKQRIITAMLLIPIVLGVLFYAPPPLFITVVGALALAAAWEWTNLMGLKSKARRCLYVLLMTVLFFNVLFVPAPLLFLLFVVAFVWWCIALVMVALYPRASAWWANSVWLRGIMGLFVLLPCWAAVVYVRAQPQGVYALLFLFVLIWGADSAAYFAGKRWGRHKLAPRVSPGKSIQGAVAAVSFAMLLTAGLLLWQAIPLQAWGGALLLSVVVVLFSILGDLFESMLKRQVGVKDSGNLLPGHGGFLDRIDSLTAAAPVFVFGVILLSG